MKFDLFPVVGTMIELKTGVTQNWQLIQVTEREVLLNCKFPMAITKGSGTQACIKYD